MWTTEKTEEGIDLVWEGVEQGIAQSPTIGTANIQNANISTEIGELLASFARVNQAQAAITNGTLTPDGDTLFDAPATLKAGTWISVSASTVTSISTTTSPTTAAISYLLVGGGGGGGGSNAGNGASGGGGAGQFLEDSSTVSVGTYSITIGAGGAGGTSTSNGTTGGSTIIAGIDTAYGGAGGGAFNAAGSNATTGGSGGGGGGGAANAGGTGATGGNDGGVGYSLTSPNAAGGGGGAGSVGDFGDGTAGGVGGTGDSSSITGTATFYAGGGGGGRDGGTGGSGGQGGGGAGNQGGDGNGSDATANTGGGGGGAGGNFAGGDGGSGIAVIAYTTGSMVAVGGTVTQVGGNTIHVFTKDGVFEVLSIPKTNLYYVSYESGSQVKLSSAFDPYGDNPLTHGTTGSVTFSTVAVPGQGIAKATEKYGTATSTEYRYYALDNNGYVWCFDSQVYADNGTLWMLPDPNNYSTLTFSGIAVLNGWLFIIDIARMFAKPTVDLGKILVAVSNGELVNPFPNHKNFAYVGNQGKMFYTDSNFIGEVFPTTSLLTSLANIQSYCKYTASTNVGTIAELYSGSVPYTTDTSGDVARIPAVFFTDEYGTQPTNLTESKVYWIEYNQTASIFQVYSASSGGTAINIATGAAGNQYFNTFGVVGDGGAGGANPTVQITSQRVNLPAREVAQCMVELGNTILIGGKTNIIYPWNQIDATPGDVIALPENDVVAMVNVNNAGYIFAGNKGNIYITNGSVASNVIKVPDYCAGVPGTKNSYIEPYFTWFDAMYLRGRVYFSIQDQTATKAGNCGGVWSFIPSQNISFGQEVGMALRLENQNSYGDYDGAATLLIPDEEQEAISPQYWSFWQDSYDTATAAFGVDYTDTVPVTTFVVETDLLATGTLLSKNSYTQLEWKLTSPLSSGDSFQLYYRLDGTSAWTSCGTVQSEANFPISGFYQVPFQKTQWVQFRGVATTNGTTSSSFVRLKQIRLR